MHGKPDDSKKCTKPRVLEYSCGTVIFLWILKLNIHNMHSLKKMEREAKENDMNKTVRGCALSITVHYCRERYEVMTCLYIRFLGSASLSASLPRPPPIVRDGQKTIHTHNIFLYSLDYLCNYYPESCPQDRINLSSAQLLPKQHTKSTSAAISRLDQTRWPSTARFDQCHMENRNTIKPKRRKYHHSLQEAIPECPPASVPLSEPASSYK